MSANIVCLPGGVLRLDKSSHDLAVREVSKKSHLRDATKSAGIFGLMRHPRCGLWMVNVVAEREREPDVRIEKLNRPRGWHRVPRELD